MIGGGIVTLAVTAVMYAVGVAHLPSAAQLIAVSPQLVYLALIGSVLAALVWTVGVRTLGATTAVLFMNLTPIIALIVAVVHGARLTPVEIGGAAITVAALLGANLVNRRVAAPAPATPPAHPVPAPRPSRFRAVAALSPEN
jgi:drug/metabolite transporter (DMT)-like permease